MSQAFKDSIEATGGFWMPLTIDRGASQTWVFEIPDYDISAAESVAAQVKSYPDATGAAEASLTEDSIDTSTTTWGDWLALRPDAVLPEGAALSTLINVSTLTYSMTRTQSSALPTNPAQAGADHELYWDCFAIFDAAQAERIMGGTFTVSAAISGASL